MWMALGIIAQSQNQHKQPEDIGRGYFNILIRKSFLIEADKLNAGRKLIVMHDCMHHMAPIVSKGECLRRDNFNLKEIPETICHLFIKLKDISVLADVYPPRNIQTLILKDSNIDGQEVSLTLNKFAKRFTNLCVLKLHSSKLHDLSVVDVNLQHIHYIDIFSNSSTMNRIPNYFRKLYHLQVIYLGLPNILNAFSGEHKLIFSEITMPGAFLKLRKLRHFHIRDNRLGKWSPVFFPGLGKVTLIQEISSLNLKDADRCKLSELKNMNNLNSSLKIAGLETVKNNEEAKEPKLHEKKRLWSLKLEWTSNDSSLEDCRSKSDAQFSTFLEPPCNLNELTIKGYKGLRPPCWLQIGCPKFLVSLSFIN